MARRGDGIEIRENSIRITFYIDKERHRETIKVDGKPIPPTPANLKYARRLAAEIRDRIKYGSFSFAEYFPASGAGAVTTLSEWLDVWLSSQRLEHSTLKGYNTCANFWKRSIGDKSIKTLKLLTLKKVIASRPDLTGKTLNNYIMALRQALDLAVSENLLSENPAANLPLVKYQKPLPDPLDRDEAEAIISSMLKRDEQVGNMVEFWMFTGLRTSEIIALKWSNVDLRKGRSLISETVVLGRHKVSTKTHTAREINLNSRAMAALKRQAVHSRMAGEHVFLDSRHGTPWEHERAFRRAFWEPCLKRLGIRYRRPYNMRHTYATIMLMAGITPAFAATQMGHSIEIFLRTYARWLDGSQNDMEMRRLEASFDKNCSLDVPEGI
ncbi:Arm DNA-binding domain-containing protein [Carnimonas bestiolae]|uniref:Arm DNA-binding domain-containing protein n=1 Tax=Carnimonas bestiolae TaxID=3402172 RepID=UPI003EDC6B34